MDATTATRPALSDADPSGREHREAHASPEHSQIRTIFGILDRFRDEKRNNREMGDRFERLIQKYLTLDPLYADRFSKVWMWSDWPGRGNSGDMGIDIVAEERATGELCAIQCKFYLPEHTLQKNDLDSFFTEMGKKEFTSGIVVSTTDKWGPNAEKALEGQSKPVTRLRVQDLDESPVDWSRFDGTNPEALGLRKRKTPLPHQREAVNAVKEGFQAHDRGKLIMACGTGKTFTALTLAKETCPQGTVLFLVPSLSLLAQSLREWTAEAGIPLHTLAVCSEAAIGTHRGKGDEEGEGITIHDLQYPASTNAKEIRLQYWALQSEARKGKAEPGMTVVFSTYQSLKAVSQAQAEGLPEFDLILCDEAHRTTGVALAGEEASAFTKVHDADFIKAKKRLYMTATPRLYAEAAKTKAKESEAVVFSMDDESLYGPEFHRLGFGKAVSEGLLSDYKVLVLAVDERYVDRAFQEQLADENNELNLDDAVRITGCWKGLQKQMLGGEALDDGKPMRRAIAFAKTINDSKRFGKQFEEIVETLREGSAEGEGGLQCAVEHVDGGFPAPKRGELLDWLKAPTEEGECRILSNAKCLSEGVDVPALDAVMFLNARKSVVDVVQAVGRVMRKPHGSDKKFGYIILPIGIPTGEEPEKALADNEKYKVVWQVLQALRAHDERLDASINSIDLNKERPSNVQIVGVGGDPGGEDGDGSTTGGKDAQGAFFFPQLDEWRDAIYARMVKKVGDRLYWAKWAGNVAALAERYEDRIRLRIEEGDPKHRMAFEGFLAELRAGLNPSVTEKEALEMLAQHLITRPVFEALFADYAFASHNPVSKAMQGMLDALHDESLEKDLKDLEPFYTSVRQRAAGIDNPEGRQKIIVELYDEFFRTAFKRTSDRLGIVYTPVEVVDFILHSVADVLKDEFGLGLGSPDVQVIDPFTGTGTFIVRLIQNDLIPDADLERKYKGELHANEIVLLAYYIAAINVEAAYHARRAAMGSDEYAPFEGIVLTDTFQLAEGAEGFEATMFPENHARVTRQKAMPVNVVVGNPPYSAQQEDANDANQNLSYPTVDERIRTTYAARSNSGNVKNLYDSYIRAIRWASDRVGKRGVVAFVTNGSFLDANNMDGLRACLPDEFTTLYVFNLRGNQRTHGETSRKEGGKIFGSGSRATVAITVMVKNPERADAHEFRYRDIGDYLTREEKLALLRGYRSVDGVGRTDGWERIVPNASHDWLGQRSDDFVKFVPFGRKDGENGMTVFSAYSLGVGTNRDAWTHNYSRSLLARTVQGMVAVYEENRTKYREATKGKVKKDWPEVDKVVDRDKSQIAWTRGLKGDVVRDKPLEYDAKHIVTTMYRPFVKQFLYFSRRLNEYVFLLHKLFPTPEHPNIVISATGVGASQAFSCLVTDAVPDLETISKGQCFPLYVYEKPSEKDGSLGLETADETVMVDGYLRREAVTDGILTEFRAAYGEGVTKRDVFDYTYGVLHSPEYRERFKNDLRKMLPRLPLTREAADFRRFADTGRALIDLHLGYETAEPYPLQEEQRRLNLDDAELYRVEKMRFDRKAKAEDRTKIIVNPDLRLTGIPLETYEYVVNGKPALNWIMERYAVTVDKDSGIRNAPDDWGREHDDPRYIVDLVKRMVTVSLETMKLVRGLPALNEKVKA